ncbi:hypothetical protein PRIPAC_79167 [Pristionchus pacificus]|uniref:Uncharacterized protein n=1 Tax=Pristionchus pacificus TaxID=54126 RepID=A0A454Y2M2_PRIPA|nr:hypothetical protein PRIPAC_79167 [Pristionchus pacificus]|eukprot:PDM70261.1 hypothetical protein PRIPAC_46507 [Pristionchus pacificus]
MSLSMSIWAQENYGRNETEREASTLVIVIAFIEMCLSCYDFLFWALCTYLLYCRMRPEVEEQEEKMDDTEDVDDDDSADNEADDDDQSKMDDLDHLLSQALANFRLC